MIGKDHKGRKQRTFSFWSYLSLCLCVSVVSLSCSSKPTDMRSLVPVETLVYLETNDLAAAIQPVVDSKPFTEAARSKPDLSPLKGVQLALAVTGFETADGESVRPRFVAVADTHAWNYQAVRFAEEKLGSFVEDIYKSEPRLERSDAKGGRFFVWTAGDRRKAYALVVDSMIYFGNDESAIDKCLAVRRGEADSFAKAGGSPPPQAALGSGHISTDGIGQIAALLGAKFASVASDDAELRDAISSVLPGEIRGTVTQIDWAMTRTDQGIEDRYQVTIPANRPPGEMVSEIGLSLSESIQETTGDELADVFGIERSGAAGANQTYSQENRTTSSGLERRTVSDLGFIGWMIEQMSQD